uniref:Uncharacterized protein n=1 Tax=Mus musculus TaxID=10090 RepID=A0ABJ3HP72_MOUSE
MESTVDDEAIAA